MVSRIVLVIIASVFIVCEFVHGGNSGGVADDWLTFSSLLLIRPLLLLLISLLLQLLL
uniref:Uncharacterized protein n=1 Tax=Trichobilharzia regenti TaxID=157069 RepID=A0AA85IYB8_TRIRE|nr:unnamed protein product [Trichobilharzia regenti]